MPDETQQAESDPQPERRRTAMQVAQDAQATADAALQLAQTIDESNRQMPEQLSSAVENLQEKVTDLDQRLRDMDATAAGTATLEEPWRAELDQFATRDQVDARIGEALDTTVRPELHALRENIAATREEWGGYSGAMTRKLDELRTRVHQVEEKTGSGSRAEAARAELDGILARIERLEALAPAEGHTSSGLEWDAIAERVTNQAKVEVQRHLALLAPAGTSGANSAVRPRGAQRKVLELMRQVDVIAKNRQTDRKAGGYSFRGIDEAMDAVGHAMRAIGLIGSPSVRSIEHTTHEARNSEGRNVIWTTTHLVGAYTFTDPEDGSTHTIELVGEGRDNSDKSTSKASSMALKYGLLHGLMIPVTGMPDGDAENPQVVRERQSEATANPNAAAPAPRAQEQSRADRAQRAVAALQELHRFQGQERYNRLVAIGNQVTTEGLMDEHAVWKGERAPLRHWLGAAQALLAENDRARQTADHRQQHPQTDEPPPPEPPGDEPPWDGAR